MESHKIIFMVLGDPDVLAVHGDEESHEEASERVSLVSGKLGPEAFKGPLLTHRKAITTGWKRVGRVSRDNPKASGVDIGGGIGGECELELEQIPLLE